MYMVKSHNIRTKSHRAAIMGTRPPMPQVAQPLEDAIYAAQDDKKRRGPAGLSFAPIFAFTMAVAQMARGQERQEILDSRPERPEGKSTEWNEGFDAAVGAFIRLLVTRSMV
jgi:hypothetical protein